MSDKEYQEGFEAAESGEPVWKNPYAGINEKMEKFSEWNNGWQAYINTL